MKNKMNVNAMDYVLTGDYYIPVLELSCRSERAGTKSPEMYYRADEGRRGRNRGIESQ